MTNKKEKNDNFKWYDSGNIIINLIIVVILFMMICSQSFANIQFNFKLFSSVINQNSFYLMVLIYFVFLKFSYGKRYFNYLNIFLIFIYFVETFTSCFTIVQSFSLNTVLKFSMNFVLFIYLSHTLFRDTRIWKEFRFYNSPFNELTNEWLFYAVVVLTVFLLADNLISTVEVSGVVISLLKAAYFVLIGRYVYLYREYLDSKKLDADNEGNFDELRDKVQNILDKTDIDDKIIDGVKGIQNKVENFIDDKNCDDEVEDIVFSVKKESLEEESKKEEIVEKINDVDLDDSSESAPKEKTAKVKDSAKQKVLEETKLDAEKSKKKTVRKEKKGDD